MQKKQKKTATIIEERKSEDMPTDFEVLEQVHCKKTPGAQSCTPVRRGESNVSRLSHTRGEIMFESEIKKNNCSGGSTQTKVNGSQEGLSKYLSMVLLFKTPGHEQDLL